MTLYQQKTTPFEAIQWTCNNYQDVIEFTSGNVALTADNQCIIVNGETVCENDWLLKLVGAEAGSGNQITKLFTCTDVMFDGNYEQYQGLQ